MRSKRPPAPRVNAQVRHRLYPELGAGRVLYVLDGQPPKARIHWPEADQTTTHHTDALCELTS